MRLGIFGGTFNPPHMGHIRLVTAIADKLQLDRVLIIPASVPPHKARLEPCSQQGQIRDVPPEL